MNKKTTETSKLPKWKKDILRIMGSYQSGDLKILDLPNEPALETCYYTDDGYLKIEHGKIIKNLTPDELISRTYDRVKKFLSGVHSLKVEKKRGKRDKPTKTKSGESLKTVDEILKDYLKGIEKLSFTTEDYIEVEKSRFPKKLDELLAELNRRGANVALIYGWLYVMCNLAIRLILHLHSYEDLLRQSEDKNAEKKVKQKRKALYSLLLQIRDLDEEELNLKPASEYIEWLFDSLEDKTLAEKLKDIRKKLGIDKQSSIKIRKNILWTSIICKLVDRLKLYAKRVWDKEDSDPKEAFVTATKLLHYCLPSVWDYDDETVNTIRNRYRPQLHSSESQA